MNATQEGVSRREQEYEELVNSRAAEREGEAEPFAEAPEVEEEQPEEEEEQPEEQPEEKPEEQEEEPKVEEPAMITLTGSDGKAYQVPADAKLRLKIDGSEVEESFDRVTRGYQKGAAADQRLEQATLRQRELEKKEEELAQRGRYLSQQEQAVLSQLQKMEQQHESGALSEDAYKVQAKTLVEALLESDDPETEVAKVLQQILPQQQQQFDPSQLDGMIEQKVQSREEQRRAEAWRSDLVKAQERFATDYSDLNADPVLRGVVNDFTKQVYQEDPNAHPWNIIEEAAKRTKKWQEDKIGPTTKKPTPRPASGRSAVGKDEKPKTRKEILDEIASARVGRT